MATALWVLPVSDLGGVARHALDVARVGLPGWRTVFVLPPGPLAEDLRGVGAAVLTAPIGPAHGLRDSLAALGQVIRALRPDIVHSHLAYADVAAALSAPRGATLVSTEHGIAAADAVYHRTRARTLARAQMHRVRLQRTSALLAVSRATLTAAEAKWHPPARVRRSVIPNGVDPQPRSSPRPGRLHVVALARFAPEKRLPLLVDAFATVSRRHPHARLTLAGDGPLREQVGAQVDRLGLSDRVDLPGHVDAGRLLEEADVVAQLSVWENCSYALLDAVARGLGVVATDVGGNAELLPRHCLVAPGDPARIADRLQEQAQRVERRPALPEQWPDVSTMAERIATAYAEVDS